MTIYVDYADLRHYDRVAGVYYTSRSREMCYMRRDLVTLNSVSGPDVSALEGSTALSLVFTLVPIDTSFISSNEWK